MNKRILLEEELAEKSKYIRINIPDSIPFTIDLKTHKILGWHSIDGNKDIYVKARDEGKYPLLLIPVLNFVKIITLYMHYTKNLIMMNIPQRMNLTKY